MYAVGGGLFHFVMATKSHLALPAKLCCSKTTFLCPSKYHSSNFFPHCPHIICSQSLAVLDDAFSSLWGSWLGCPQPMRGCLGTCIWSYVCGLTAGELDVFGGFGTEQKHTHRPLLAHLCLFILGTLTLLLAFHICCCFSMALTVVLDLFRKGVTLQLNLVHVCLNLSFMAHGLFNLPLSECLYFSG